MDTKTDVLIVGAGFAGAATAFHLSADYSGSILLVDKEEVPGFHASGRNASLLLQSVESPLIRALAATSRKAYEKHRSDVGLESTGSLLLGGEQQLERVRQPELISSEMQTAARVRRWIPVLEGNDFECALWTPSDGVMDIARLLDFYLDGARSRGVRISLDTRITGIEGEGPFRVATRDGHIQAGIVVNAAGAWASAVARMAGIEPIPLYPLKRHLFVLDEVGDVDPTAPFVWSLSGNFYFRPESGGLLFSICDEEYASSLEPTVSSEISERLAEVIWKHLPGLRDAVQRKVWSCFRTKAADGGFVIGPDPQQPAFFWVAGLGGHGMGCSWQVGAIAGAALRGAPEDIPAAFLPGRQAGDANGGEQPQRAAENLIPEQDS